MRRKFIFFCYRVLQAAALPLLTVYVVWRILRDRRYLTGLAERAGFLPPSYKRTASGAIWLHAVSLGEVLSSAGLIARLREQHPGSALFVSCGTTAGRQVAMEKLAGIVDGIFYLPFDYCFAVRRVLRHIRPASVIVLETEIWPNLYHETKRCGAALTIVNGRISPRALPRYRRLRWFFQSVLDLPDHLLVQSDEDFDNYVRSGAPKERVQVNGNLKYDFQPPDSGVPQILREFIGTQRKIWIAASTTAPTNNSTIDEDDVVIDAFLQLQTKYPDLLLLIAPRKTERFDIVAAKLQAAGIAFARRTALSSNKNSAVLLLDSIGELSTLFGLADVVLMGGTLTDRGGHNILEPAIFAKPVIVGPHMENFPEIAARFRAANAVKSIDGPEQLVQAVDELLSKRLAAVALGERAKLLAEAQRGATDRALRMIAQDRAHALPHVLPYGPAYPLLWALSKIWAAGGAFKRRGQPGRLQTPVISIGGIGMGGAGKTPMVRHLAARLSGLGYKPAILTRGYRRDPTDHVTNLPAGAAVPVRLTGDEPQMFLRDGFAPVGIGADRYAVGRRMEERFQPDLFLLDDGFQHSRLHRDVDLVLLDGLDPLAGGEVFPLGRLREPLPALRRATAFVITRTAGGGVRDTLAKYNPGAPVFTSRVVPVHWVDAHTGTHRNLDSLQEITVAAFCGLANPDAFWLTLQQLGITPAAKTRFSDHHRYSAEEIQKLSGVVLVTTEKDSMNLPPTTAEGQIFWLKIGIEIDNEAALLSQIVAAIRSTSSSNRL
ncbi:MAG: tetraacyldisaccharide 4'-kinase [Bryobacteraceae bacterium]